MNGIQDQHSPSRLKQGGVRPSPLRVETFVPRLIQTNPLRRVHPCQGTVVHVSLSGLSPLPGYQESGGPEVEAECQRILSTCLGSLTDQVDRFDGDTLEVTPAGLLVLFPDEADPKASVDRALACSLAMREALYRVTLVGGTGIPLQIRFGVASGVLHGLLLGEAAYGQVWTFAGTVLEAARRAALAASDQQILIEPSAGARLDPDLVRTLPPLPTPAMARLEALLRPYEPGESVLPRLASGTMPAHLVSPELHRLFSRGEQAYGIRKLSVLSVMPSGLSPAGAAGSDPLHSWISRLQKAVEAREGYLLGVCVEPTVRATVIFGAPVNHPDDETRALQCALDLQRMARDHAAVSDQRLGLATGGGFVGLMGGASRAQLGLVAQAELLARELGNHAGPWEVLVDRQTVSRSGFGFDWGPPPPAPPGSHPEALTARVLYGEGAYGTKLTSRSRGAPLGREQLMSQLRTLADHAVGGHGLMVCLNGAAGIGKSALVLWLGHYLQQNRRVPVYRGECNALVRQAPFHAWIPVFRAWLDLQPGLAAEDAVARVLHRVASLGLDLLPRVALLNLVTGLNIPESSTTQGLDARKRRDALHAFVLELFQRAHNSRPISLIFEDIHWMDEASAGLLRYMVRNLSSLPILVVTSRRPDEPEQAEAVLAMENLPGLNTFHVGTMSPEALRALACRHIGAQRLEPGLEKLLVERSQGNPLHLEELTLYLRDLDQIQPDRDGTARLLSAGAAPMSLQDVIRARVGRLDEGAQLTLKAASVVGRTFTLSLLQEIYPVPFDLNVLLGRLDRVEGLDIVRREEPGAPGETEERVTQALRQAQGLNGDSAFYFKHALIRDTIYDMLTNATRRVLHEAVAVSLERRLTPENRAELVLVIAEHYRRTLCTEKQRFYYREAGEIARARALNREAWQFFQSAEALYQLVGEREVVADLLESQVAVLNLMGDRDAQREAIARWKETARELNDDRRMADALRAEANLLMRTGEPNKALKLLERARRLARAHNELLQEARILRVVSRVHFQQADLPKALEAAEAALALTVGLSNWQEAITDEANLGTILAQLNQVAAGRAKLENALRRAKERGDIRLSGIVLSNLGVLDEQDGRHDRALELWEQALGLKRQVGERQEEVVTLTNMGHAHMLLGNFEKARILSEEALQLAHQIEERWIEATICLNLGTIFASLRNFEDARVQLRRAIELSEGSGSKYIQVEALEMLARVDIAQGDLEGAEQAVQWASNVGEHHRLTLSALSAWVKSERGQLAEAELELSRIQRGLEEGLSNEESSCQIRFLVAQVLKRAGKPEARTWLEAARSELLALAERVEDRTLRAQMLQAVPENRAILEAWDSWASSL